MSFDLLRVLEGKRVNRRRLASRPIGEKLHMLDLLRERELAIRSRAADTASASGVVREESAPYQRKPG